MTTPKPDTLAAATPASPTTLTQANRDFFKEPDFSTTTAPKDGPVTSPTVETAKLGINSEPKVDVVASPVVAPTINGQAQETSITSKAEAASTAAPAPAAAPTSPTTITPATTTVATSAVPGITAAIAAAVNSTNDVDMTLAPGTPIEEMNLLVDESIDEDSDQDQDFSDEPKENGTESEEARQARQDLHRQLVDTQQKLQKRERDYEVMSKNYLEHVRLIRATDDDHSTIIDRLTQLKASIEHLVRKAQGSRSVNLNKEVVIEHFKNSGLLEGFPIPADKLEAFHLNLYMESVIMSTLVTRFFGKALSCIFSFNEGFKDIYDWMHERNEKLAVRWRQQLCVMITQDPATKTRQEEEVNAVATELSELVTKVYTNANELPKLKDLCNKAFELSVAMTALESVISPETVALGTPFDEENMGTSLKSNPEGKVALVIFPSFVDKERAFNIRPKVWCY
ncbi:hypothetical protein BG015_007849 [Linnemannia schmuckeri]|uniref:Uncharacterized protein n=1 Tax=Linnemannia schmuckeri TaxID=64567 RepID=A0A9P5RXW4_9FUNG|nr:hypothetical protein BG015_007849 [Linnemannia schmuckeri]